MCAIGALIVCRNLSTAQAIIKSIFIIAYSETFGKGTPSLNNGEKLIMTLASEESPSATYVKELVQNCISEEVSEDPENAGDTDMSHPPPPNTDTHSQNFWRQWGLSLKDEALSVIAKEMGEYDNPRFCPQIAVHLLKKVETIAMWGNICRGEFGFGRCPASSAAAEGEFNLVKTHILQQKTKRIDALVETLIQQDKGRLVLLQQKQGVADLTNSTQEASRQIQTSSEVSFHSALFIKLKLLCQT